jgi:hypothetical protein
LMSSLELRYSLAASWEFLSSRNPTNLECRK